MSRLAVVIPTIGRPSLGVLLDSLIPQLQEGDRVVVVCDNPEPAPEAFTYDIVLKARAEAPQATWRCYTTPSLGCYGHAARNRALDHLAALEDAPGWFYSIDDDDCVTFGALDFIRSAIESPAAPWYVFRMRGGDLSHFPGLVVPATGGGIRHGEIGTPMIVAPVCKARFGTEMLQEDGAPFAPGYFGDLRMAEALRDELGEPEWRSEIVAEIRPALVTA